MKLRRGASGGLQAAFEHLGISHRSDQDIRGVNEAAVKYDKAAFKTYSKIGASGGLQAAFEHLGTSHRSDRDIRGLNKVTVKYDKAAFKTYSEASDGQEVQMGNEVRSKVVGTGSVELNFTSGKKENLILTRNGVFVGKRYSAEGMIKLCINDNIINEIAQRRQWRLVGGI